MAPKVGKFSKRAQESGLGRLVDEVLREQPDSQKKETGSELDFILSPQGLNLELYPVQRLIVKATFGIPLDYQPVMVPIWDTMRENLLYEFTEKEAVHYFYEEGKCNVQNWDDIPVNGFSTVVAYAGRRGGKSEIVASIGGAMLRNLLMIEDPQEYYSLPKGSPIDFSFMGTDDTGAKRIYTKLRQRINGSPFFSPYIRTNNLHEMQFVSKSDRGNRDVIPSIKVAAYPCTTQTARGPSNYFLTLDEFQFFRSSKETNSSDMYKAATPSTAQFAPVHDKDTPDSKVLVISSAANRIGKMYELHRLGLDEGVASGIFTMRLSTVELNPRIPAGWLAKELKQNADTFAAEIGGKFLDGAGSYVPEVKFNLAVDKGRQNLIRFSLDTVGRKYFWGLDLAMKKNGTGLAIGHLEMVEGSGIQLIFDYIDRMMVGERFEGPGVELVEEQQKFLNYKELDLEDLLKWLIYMHQILPCFKGLTDQHAGVHLKQLLQINGIHNMELRHLNDQVNSKMYSALQGRVHHGTARFPDVPKFAAEFKMLEASYRSKYVLAVAAPTEKGATDDMSDGAALVALQAEEWLEEFGMLDLDPTAKILQVNPALLPPVPIGDINGIGMRDLQILERVRTIQSRPLVSARDIARGNYGRRR